jgi:DNA helicase IV
MTYQHPDIADEQAYIEHAYDCLETSRKAAFRIRTLNEASMGGTFQARFERNAFDAQLVRRLEELELGTASLVFGRIDRYGDSPDQIEAFHIGRLAIADEDREPVVVDWRAPVSEPFYRATGRDQMGLARRRHFIVESKTLLGIEDELFGEGHLGLGHDDGLADTEGSGVVRASDTGLRGHSTLLAALEKGRTGTLGDIVATIQGEQDEIIRSPQHGVLVVQGGPGTGKTVVALHRAAYLLYTHRFPLEDQGVLVIGPNRVFLRYIERVLPSLGEAGVKQAVLADLIPGVEFRRADEPGDSREAVKLKGEDRMSDLIDNAVADRKRALRDDLEMPFRAGYVRIKASETARIVKNARRRFKRHNAGRRAVEAEFWTALADSYRDPEIGPRDVKGALRDSDEARRALDRMWPVLTPAQLLHDLFGSRGLLKLASRGVMTEAEALSLFRRRSPSVDDVRWTAADVAILDDVRDVLGPKPGKGGKVDVLDEIRTYGHIVIDEVQDLTPMQLKMATRRSLNGAMTIVGDLAQATGPLAPDEWDDVLRYLPDRKPARVIGLSVGYRIPGQIMELANRVMAVATPSLRAPDSVRLGDVPPSIVRASSAELLAKTVATEVQALADAIPGASLGVVAPDGMIEELSEALTAAGIDHGTATRTGLDAGVTLVPVSVVKGLELDGVVVVEPAGIVDSIEHGLRALYVALTRSTQRLTVVHAADLPDAIAAQQ